MHSGWTRARLCLRVSQLQVKGETYEVCLTNQLFATTTTTAAALSLPVGAPPSALK